MTTRWFPALVKALRPVLLALCLPAWAHKPSDSYLTLTVGEAGRVGVVWHVALRDLDSELSLDANDDGRLTWGEVRGRWGDLRRFAQAHLRLTHAGEACALQTERDGEAQQPALTEHTDGRYAVFGWTQQCASSPGQPWSNVTVDYDLFALSDPTHRGIVRWRLRTAAGALQDLGVVVLGATRTSHVQSWAPFPSLPSPGAVRPGDGTVPNGPANAARASGPADVGAPPSASPVPPGPSRWAQVQRMVHDGIEHIASGTDHILFLVLLLLVAVWRRDAAGLRSAPMAGWSPRDSGKGVVGEVLRLVTAFTVAHSITLGLASFGVVSPPSRWVESLIALSVLVAAVDNLWPLMRAPRWAVVFAFGLVHGFGFAGAMQDLGLSSEGLAWPLLGFNLGVELGQLALVAVVLPVAFALRRTAIYRWGVVLPGSLAIGLLAGVWLIERSTDRIILGWGGG